jgi:hypothetical protein
LAERALLLGIPDLKAFLGSFHRPAISVSSVAPIQQIDVKIGAKMEY